MDATRFDALIRSLNTGSTRRGFVPRLTAAVLGLEFAGRFPQATGAKKRQKRKKKPKFNQFGCVDVGGFCKVNDQCCSDLC